MTPTITAFKNSPDRGRGLARDMRVRWALEEVGQPYDVQLLTFEELKAPPYRKIHPFGSIPSYREGETVLFESAAIVFYIGEKFGKILPPDPLAKMRALQSMFAAVNSVEPPIFELGISTIVEGSKPYHQERLPMLIERVHSKVKDLSARMGDSEWLDGAFSGADIMMVTTLRRLDGKGILESYPNIVAYIKRAEARPGYQRAFAAQLEVYKASVANEASAAKN